MVLPAGHPSRLGRRSAASRAWACAQLTDGTREPSPHRFVWRRSCGSRTRLRRCPLAWADLDLLGHVNNVTYVDYLQEARVDMFRTHAPDSRADDLAEGVVVVRHEVTYVSPLTFSFEPVTIECWVTEVRAASLHDGLRDLRRGRGRRAHRPPARPHRADAVRLRHRAPAPAPRRGDGGALARCSSPTSRSGARAPPTSSTSPGGALPGPRALLRRRRLRPRQQREVLRVLPGGAHPADGRPGARARRGRTTSSSRRPTSTTRVPILFRPEPYDCRTWVSRIGDTLGRRSSP